MCTHVMAYVHVNLVVDGVQVLMESDCKVYNVTLATKLFIHVAMFGFMNIPLITSSQSCLFLFQAFFVAYGPAFKHQHTVPPFENIEIYNLLTGLFYTKFCWVFKSMIYFQSTPRDTM